MKESAFVTLLDRAKAFVEAALIPAEGEVDRTGCIPSDILADMAALGLHGMSIPTAYGGLGLSMVQETRLMFTLGRAAPAYRAHYALNSGGGPLAILAIGTETQKDRYLPALASGRMMAAFAMSEYEAGSDAAAIALTANRDVDSYILNGTKRYVTHGPNADLIVVFARTDGMPGDRQGITAFLVDKGTPGLEAGDLQGMMGLRGVHVSDLHFRDCRLPQDAVLGGCDGHAFKAAMTGLDKVRLHVAALCVGLADRLIGEAQHHVAARRQFGRPIGEFQMTQAALADMKTNYYAARCMTLETARAQDANLPVSGEAAACKLFASEACFRIADLALQLHGGAGYVAGSVVERLFRDSRLFRILDGTSEMQRLIVAKRLETAAFPKRP